MSAPEATAAALVHFARLAAEARDLRALVQTQYDLRAALRHALVTRQWAELDEARRALAGTHPYAARLDECLLAVLEVPELGRREGGARWHGLMLAVPVSLTSRSGTLVSLPPALATALRDSLQARFPSGTAIRLLGRAVPQLVAHGMGPQALYELVEALASGQVGAPAAPAAPGAQPAREFVPAGASLGRHYLFALALTTRPDQLALELPGELQSDPGFAAWAAAQTERITSGLAELGLPVLVRVSPPRRLREMLASPPLFGDVRELDGLLEQAAVQSGAPVATLKADLALAHGNESGLRIAISERAAGTPLVHGVYRVAALGAEGGAYRAAVRLASAGVELTASDESLRRAVERAITLANPPAEPAAPGALAASRRFGAKALRSRFARSAGPAS
jgi:hypothetical protein